MSDAEDFYRAEAAYWQAQAEQLRARILDLFNLARQASLVDLPPEPPIGTQFIHARTGQLEWTRRADGLWECGPQPRRAYGGIGADHGPKPCTNCPADWPDVAELLDGRRGIYVHRVLPGEQLPAPSVPATAARLDATTERLHTLTLSCWCDPATALDGHINEDGTAPEFAATDSDPIDAAGFLLEEAAAR